MIRLKVDRDKEVARSYLRLGSEYEGLVYRITLLVTLLARFNAGVITPSYISFLHQVSRVLFPFLVIH